MHQVLPVAGARGFRGDVLGEEAGDELAHVRRVLDQQVGAVHVGAVKAPDQDDDHAGRNHRIGQALHQRHARSGSARCRHPQQPRHQHDGKRQHGARCDPVDRGCRGRGRSLRTGLPDGIGLADQTGIAGLNLGQAPFKLGDTGGALVRRQVGIIPGRRQIAHDLQLDDRVQMRIRGRQEEAEIQWVQDRSGLGNVLGRAHATVIHEEVLQPLLGFIVQIRAPDDRIGLDRRRRPDHPDASGNVRAGPLQQRHVGGVVGADIDQPVRHRHGIGLVIGIADRVEAGRRVNAARGKDEGRRHQVARGRVGIPHAEIDRAVTGQHVLDRLQRAVDRNDQHRVVTLGTIRIGGLGEDLAAAQTDSLQAGEIGEPRHLDRVVAHRLDHAGIVGGVEGLDVIARPFRHGGDEGAPVGFQVGGGFRCDDAEIQRPAFTLARLGDVLRSGILRYRCAASRQAQHSGDQGKAGQGLDQGAHHSSPP